MNPDESGIFSLASVGRYLDALSSITAEMSLADRRSLIFLDKCLHEQWRLGQNVILNWCPTSDGIELLVLPHYLVAEISRDAMDGDGYEERVERVRPSEEFIRHLLSSSRRLSPEKIRQVSRLLGVETTTVSLGERIPESHAHLQIVEKMIKRYSISYVPNRAAALFDIVGFGLLSPFEQLSQLNSLSYSLNSAQSRLLSKQIDISFARSSTGDGFYIWNRDLSLEANINLYHFMHLVLADNAIALRKSSGGTVPKLRTCFHVGSCYEFHQAEGLNPTLYNYIVGDLTIELARMIESALPGQILVGDFNATLPTGRDSTAPFADITSLQFITNATKRLAKLEGLELSGDQIDSIKCYLTGRRLSETEYAVRRIVVNDKHGMTRHVYNAKVNIYRYNGDPILLGIEDRYLDELGQDGTTGVDGDVRESIA